MTQSKHFDNTARPLQKQGLVWLGTSGLVFSEPNKQAFPPQFRTGSRLAYYAHLFNSLEVNSSFYKIPQPATFEKWAADTPHHFKFTVKLWRGITHVKNLAFSNHDIHAFMHAANMLGHKKGCLLIQLPPSVTAGYTPQLDTLLSQLSLAASDTASTPPWRPALEFRHPSWYNAATYTLLSKHQAALVLHDMPSSSITISPPGSPAFVYLRFHGPSGDYKGGYPAEFLRQHAHNIQQWLSEQKEVFVYFNNTIGDAISNCKTLNSLIGS